MRRGIAARLALIVLLGAGGLPAAAAEHAAPDPETLAALRRMGAYLRTLTAFQVDAVTTQEDVLDDGQKAQYTGSATLLAHKPDKLRAEVSDPYIKRLFLYDGKSFTLFAERAGYYATVPAPPTIVQLADELDHKYGWSVPLADLFHWGSPGWSPAAIQHAIDLGPSEVAGVTCQQYALRQDDLDWQIWIQKGDYPLPRKLVITTRSDEARPEYSAVYTWNLAPSYNEATFKFEAPPDTHRVALRVSELGKPSKPPAARGRE